MEVKSVLITLANNETIEIILRNPANELYNIFTQLQYSGYFTKFFNNYNKTNNKHNKESYVDKEFILATVADIELVVRGYFYDDHYPNYISIRFCEKQLEKYDKCVAIKIINNDYKEEILKISDYIQLLKLTYPKKDSKYTITYVLKENRNYSITVNLTKQNIETDMLITRYYDITLDGN